MSSSSRKSSTSRWGKNIYPRNIYPQGIKLRRQSPVNPLKSNNVVIVPTPSILHRHSDSRTWSWTSKKFTLYSLNPFFCGNVTTNIDRIATYVHTHTHVPYSQGATHLCHDRELSVLTPSVPSLVQVCPVVV